MKIAKLLTILAVATLPFFASCISEAERQRIAAEREEQRKQALIIARKNVAVFEKKSIRERLQNTIFPSEQKLSEEERSRGRVLLEAFGEEQMPTLAELCKNARRNYLEAEANLNELIVALKAENPNFNPNQKSGGGGNRYNRGEKQQSTNPVFEAARDRYLDLASEYWWLRYKLTGFYSQFKIGAITSDEFTVKDEEFAKR